MKRLASAYLIFASVLLVVMGFASSPTRAEGGGGGGGGGGENPSAQTQETESALQRANRRREETERDLERLNRRGRTASPTPASTPPATAPSTVARILPGPPPIPENEASTTVRLPGGNTVFTRPTGWSALFYTPTYPAGHQEVFEGWTTRTRLVNGWTVYSGYADGSVVLISPTGQRSLGRSRQ